MRLRFRLSSRLTSSMNLIARTLLEVKETHYFTNSYYQSDDIYSFKDSHRGKVASNKTPTLLKSMNMDIWLVGTSEQLYIRSS